MAYPKVLQDVEDSENLIAEFVKNLVMQKQKVVMVGDPDGIAQKLFALTGPDSYAKAVEHLSCYGVDRIPTVWEVSDYLEDEELGAVVLLSKSMEWSPRFLEFVEGLTNRNIEVWLFSTVCEGHQIQWNDWDKNLIELPIVGEQLNNLYPFKSRIGTARHLNKKEWKNNENS